ncbi:MAG: DnaA ATPase domain-containing protein [Thermoguttaceae bacterium]|jgi:chromosomal replication initiator protein
MTQTRNARLGNQLLRALCERIGSGRFETWFVPPDARLEVRDDTVIVWVMEDFYADFIRSTFGSHLNAIVSETLGRALPVIYQKSATPESLPVGDGVLPSTYDAETAPNAAQHFPEQRQRLQQIIELSDEPRPSLLPFPPQNANRRATPQTPSSVLSTDAPNKATPPQPPKRKRGRPRKDSAPAENVGSLTPTPSPGRTGDQNAPASVDAAPSEPPKRKRGRPRKNPTPQAPQTPSVAFSFADAYSRSLLEAQNASASQAQKPFDLSDSERASNALGDFGELSKSDASKSQSAAPRKRGRPKKTANSKSSTRNDSGAAAPTAGGYALLQQSRDNQSRAKSDDTNRRRFASLKTFVVGASNDTAYKILDLVASNPGMMTPLYLFGSTSVGKTHLLEGVCDAYSRNPQFASKPPLYLTTEQFTTAFIRSLQGGSPFRNRFRNISLFALDDLQFLEGKKSTQTELVYVLDFLRNHGIQVVISGKRPVNDIGSLREELVTRIQSGLYAEIAPPERETLAVILQRQAFERNLIVPEDVCRYVVSRFATHAREISGAINRLYAMHLTTGAPITLEFARQALADLATVAYRNIRIEDVERVVLEHFSLEPNALKSSSRAKRNADPRAIAMWLARKHTRAALSEIGAYFGGRRHSSVISAQKKVEGWLRDDASVPSHVSPNAPVPELIKTLERALMTVTR